MIGSGFDILFIIAVTCQTGGGMFSSASSIDESQKACQKALISCYEKSFPHIPRPKAEEMKSWEGSLKSCIQAR